ncbi:receptor-interacting serine/threonine-protein kinase 3 isoform X1 [Xiphophorus hellerii]|uniref:receptor-interacting serine/threonine-protein kinase 3 isoform X1 n=1 Tax=Xiphophorus hellerii TaxID=8084 RepID=UPI0013B413ED|nr:receptor-interacting serine/threonine-protein kinase 3-like isoform X1 [Xiphophorus hellerii]
MALHNNPALKVVKDTDLEGWEVIGSGGFGQIYKAKHRQWCFDVAIKLLHYDDGTSKDLLRELDMMHQGSNRHVLQAIGIFKGQSPSSGSSIQLGLVMDFMERGSLANLLQTLQGPPPWPLAFRLTHQVALGINFLHSLSPPVLHLDLKPSNVLLDSDLNAKLTDFGLARFSISITRTSKKDSEDPGGTMRYMPPEAFDTSYNPSRASDIYSFGILLWSIATGKKPYPNAMSAIVPIRIPMGDRPSLDDIRCTDAGVAGLTRLIDLMQECWCSNPQRRPSSHQCTTAMEELFKMHKPAIHDAVHHVLQKLDQTEKERITHGLTKLSITETSAEPVRAAAANICDSVRTGPPPVQEIAGTWPANQGDNAAVGVLFLDPSPSWATNLCDVDQTRRAADPETKSSSVEPTQPTHLAFNGNAKNLPPLFLCQRQFSSPGTFNIHCSSVTGLQYGNNNTMHISLSGSSERKRHPTAPSTVSSSQQRTSTANP